MNKLFLVSLAAALTTMASSAMALDASKILRPVRVDNNAVGTATPVALGATVVAGAFPPACLYQILTTAPGNPNIMESCNLVELNAVGDPLNPIPSCGNNATRDVTATLLKDGGTCRMFDALGIPRAVNFLSLSERSSGGAIGAVSFANLGPTLHFVAISG